MSAEFAQFEELLSSIRSRSSTTWSEIETRFVGAVSDFDREYVQGGRTSGWYQTKARYFNDVVVEVLQSLSRKEVASRAKRKSHLFDEIDIDICYPPGLGRPVVAAEVKALGTPPHERNGWKPRPGAQDLHKRVREVAFTSTDLKAAYAQPRPIQSFQQWIDVTDPGYLSFWAVRVRDDKDFEKVRTTLTSLQNFCNRVGAIMYRPTSRDQQTDYEVVTPTNLSMDRAIREMAQRIA